MRELNSLASKSCYIDLVSREVMESSFTPNLFFSHLSSQEISFTEELRSLYNIVIPY
jgi:hypothetical protein